MSGWLSGALVLMIGGLGPALWLGMSGRAAERLVGLVLAGSVTVLAMVLLSRAFGQSSYLIVPLVLVVLGFAGTLVFTRLLGLRR